jgi:hypothetical protein
LAVKDAQRVAGKRTTHGSLIFKDSVDAVSDPMIERLEQAGAIIFARTTTPEFCLSGVTHSRIWGVTRNPWNTDGVPAARPAVRPRPCRRPHHTRHRNRHRRFDPHSRRLLVVSSASSRRMAATPMDRPPTSTASTIAAP